MLYRTRIHRPKNVADLPNEFLKSYLHREQDKEVTLSEDDATSSSSSFLFVVVDKGR
jgi:predicted NUDIX family phosphoesterase